MVRILINITHGYQARMILRSQVAQTLLDCGSHIVVVSPNAQEEYFRNEFSHSQITLELMPTRTSTWETRLSAWRQYLLMNPALGATLNYKRETLRREQPRRYYLTRACNLLLGNVPPLRRAYMNVETRLFPAREFDSLLAKHEPHLIVTGTPGFNVDDVHLIRAANRIDVPTATVMLSWDNLTSKGYMNGTPDYLLVWSELMAREAVEYHDFSRDRIFLTGAAQFDVYHRGRAGFDRDGWRRDKQIPKDALLMVYGTINPAICPHEIEILREIIRVMRNSNTPRGPYLWIRLHPQVVNGPWKQELHQFLELNAHDVHVEVPDVHNSVLNWDLPKQDATHLMRLLCSADMVLTTSSTLSIDAACAGTPIYNVFFDGCDVPKEMSVRRFRNYTHYAQILATGAIGEIENTQQLARVIERGGCDYLGLGERIVRQQLMTLDGMAGQRTAEKLMDLAQVQTSESTLIREAV